MPVKLGIINPVYDWVKKLKLNLFKKISPKYVLFSSTSVKTEWDFAWGHINVKEQDEWVNMFNGFGYKLLKEMKYPTEYTKLFIKL